MSKEHYQKTIRSLGILIVVLAIFCAGVFTGTSKVVSHFLTPRQADLSSISAAAPSNIDLSEFWYVWNLMNKKYPFSAQAPSDANKVYGAIQGLVSSYKDPYTMFFPPQEAKLFNAQVKGSFGGIGVEVGIKDGVIMVIAPLKGSPAAKVGIKSGDVITEIDGKKTDLLDIDTAVSLIRGDVGTTVDLGVVRKGSPDVQHFVVTRDIVNLPVIDTAQKGDVFVISLYSFSEDSAQKFTDALNQFVKSGKSKLIIDLRNNPGGYLDAAVDIASYFLPSGQTVVREDSGSSTPEVVHQSKGYTLLAKNPQMAILVNGGSASASEILSGALSEHGVAKLVGTTTFGKGSVQEVVDLDDGSSVKITVAKWLTPNGVSISDKGIKPDIEVEGDITQDPKTGVIKDPQLDAAIKLLDK